MPLINCTFNEFVTHIRSGKKSIICYGAGMLPLYIEPLLARYRLADAVRLFVDGDRKKEGKTVPIQGRNIQIVSPDCLKTLEAGDYVILITAERYKEILERLGAYVDLEYWECYAYPLLNLSFFRSTEKKQLEAGPKSFIPKVIHAIWFGEKSRENSSLAQDAGKDDLRFRCMESWRKYCPDYEIREWNENNYDIGKNRYIEQAYRRKKWAYVSDYVRLDILYRYGGIYLDTDVELKKSMDALLTTKAFLCFGEWPAPNSGAGIGCVKGHPIIREMMETREKIDFVQEGGRNDPHTNSNYEMRILMRHGFQMDFGYQSTDGMVLYPPDVIAPVSVTGKDSFVTERSIGIHYCNNSWRGATKSTLQAEA